MIGPAQNAPLITNPYHPTNEITFNIPFSLWKIMEQSKVIEAKQNKGRYPNSSSFFVKPCYFRLVLRAYAKRLYVLRRTLHAKCFTIVYPIWSFRGPD